MDSDVETRLARAGLPADQVQAEMETFDSLSPDDQQEFRNWLQQVSDPDIVEALGAKKKKAEPAHD